MTEIYSLNHQYYQVLQNHHQKICTYIKKALHCRSRNYNVLFIFFVIITTISYHATLQFCTSDVSRVTGPSSSDINFAYNQGLPGILYDYSVNNLIGGTCRDAPYKIYTFGPEQRTF